MIVKVPDIIEWFCIQKPILNDLSIIRCNAAHLCLVLTRNAKIIKAQLENVVKLLNY